MADPSKTEKATPKRREKAREECSLLRVPDLDATIMLWGNLFLFIALGGATMTLMGQIMAFYLRKTGEVGFVTQDNLQGLALNLPKRPVLILSKGLVLRLSREPGRPAACSP